MTAPAPGPALEPGGTSSASIPAAELRETSTLRAAVRAIGIALVVLDFGSLGFLLWTLAIPWFLAIPLGTLIGWFTAYELQWHFLISPRAYRAAGSKGRFIAAAAVIVVVNLCGGYLLLMRLWYTYLTVRIVAALIGAYAWTRWQVKRLNRKPVPGSPPPPR